ncbi:type 1 periplasmic-binding domain-containing protein [Cypionkella psychrotolerans]|uniref:hypothetical protein n=1 Tax=Cypionkella psychrotolerans TaxID=1678131 RepID=UPI0009EC8726|nr:hypothetical protein [Cypionkella psychrotolerans]
MPRNSSKARGWKPPVKARWWRSIAPGDAQTEAAALEVLAGSALIGVLYTSLMTRTVQPPVALAIVPTILLNCHVAGASYVSVVPADVTGAYARPRR